MTLRVCLIIPTEFLRLVLRQLLRQQVGVEILGETAAISEMLGLPHADCLIIERAVCDADPAMFASAIERNRGRVILVGDGPFLSSPTGIMPNDVILVPAGSSETKLDPSALRARLDIVLAAFHSAPLPVPLVGPERKVGLGNRGFLPNARTKQRPALVGMAASTGGPEALELLLKALQPPVCPIIVALHVPEEHTASVAHHLAAVSGHAVLIGEAGPLPKHGVVLLRGGADHAVIMTAGGLSLRRVRDGASPFHPNGDILLTSIADLDRSVIGVILSGMGSDGCEGAKTLATRGHPVLVQRPSSCVVAGMPAAVIAASAASEIAIPTVIAGRLNDCFARPEHEQEP